MTMHFDKPVSVDGKETCDLTFTGKITITGKDQITMEAGTKFFIGNSTVNLYGLLNEMVNQIKSLVLFGQPGIHTVTPASKLALDAFQQAYIEPFLTGTK
jgi:hypothetical protein